jgi:hypothetical protein
MGVSLSTVNRGHMAYDHGGIEALKPKPNGGRKHENMTLPEAKSLRARFATAAGAGEIFVRRAGRTAARRGRRLRIMFADEARFGRMNRIRPCWARSASRIWSEMGCLQSKFACTPQ